MSHAEPQRRGGERSALRDESKPGGLGEGVMLPLRIKSPLRLRGSAWDLPCSAWPMRRMTIHRSRDRRRHSAFVKQRRRNGAKTPKRVKDNSPGSSEERATTRG